MKFPKHFIYCMAMTACTLLTSCHKEEKQDNENKTVSNFETRKKQVAAELEKDMKAYLTQLSNQKPDALKTNMMARINDDPEDPEANFYACSSLPAWENVPPISLFSQETFIAVDSTTNDSTAIATWDLDPSSGLNGGVVSVDSGIEPVNLLTDPPRYRKIAFIFEPLTSGIRARILTSSGYEIGRVIIEDSTVHTIETALPYSVPANKFQEVTTLSKWWGCTKNCGSFAHVACYGNPDCMMLLVFSNLRMGTSPGGLGSGSIMASCGIWCAKNPNSF